MILVTGANGQLGSDVCSELKQKNISFIPCDIDSLDITNKESVFDFFNNNDISAVIHCAAYTAVDKAEEDFKTCLKVNVYGTMYLAECCNEKNIKILYVSTDYVFGGEGTVPFETTDEISPINYYGKSKFMGEVAVKELCKKYFIVRTSWVFGEKNTNFIHTMLKLSETRDFVNVVCDQNGSPTYSKHLAKLLCEIIETEKYGTYHATNEGFCSWYELAKKVFEIAKKETKVFPVTSDQYKTAAKRPHNSRLSKKSLVENGFRQLPLWEDAVKEYLNNIF